MYHSNVALANTRRIMTRWMTWRCYQYHVWTNQSWKIPPVRYQTSISNIGRSPQRWGYGPWWACLEKTEWIAFTLILQNHFNDDLPSCHTKNIPKNWQPCCNSSICSQKQRNQRALWMFHIQIRDVLTQKNWILFMMSFLLKHGTLTEPANQAISCVVDLCSCFCKGWLFAEKKTMKL